MPWAGLRQYELIHRWSAFILVLGSVYHLFVSGYRLFVKRERMRILPRWKDAIDLKRLCGSTILAFKPNIPR